MKLWDKKRRIKHRYDVTAQMYDARYADEQTAKIEAALQCVNFKDTTVLDVGCGTGISFDYIADKAQVIVGIDISKKSLLQAKKRSRDHLHAQLIQADADNMPLKNEVFERILAVTIIQNMPAPTKTLKEIKRVAKCNATLVITGLKKVVRRSSFEKMLEVTFPRFTMLENEDLNCCIAICVNT